MDSSFQGQLAGTAKAAPIKDSDIAGFVADVIEPSMQVPVLVDFWAPWCGPCKQLSPVLEKVVTAAGGKVRLVKVNIDEPQNQPLAQQLRIQSIPAVFAFKGGQPVDGFMGALPESQIKQFIDRLLDGNAGENPIEALLTEAKTVLENGDAAEAAQIYAEIHDADPGNPQALAGIARSALQQGQLEQAKQALAMVPPEHAAHADVAGAQAAVTLAEETAGASGDIAPLAAKLAADPGDHQARYDLALAYLAANQREQAVEELLELVRRNRAWNEEAARKQLVKLFEAFGPTDPLTITARRQLSSLLFS